MIYTYLIGCWCLLCSILYSVNIVPFEFVVISYIIFVGLLHGEQISDLKKQLAELQKLTKKN